MTARCADADTVMEPLSLTPYPLRPSTWWQDYCIQLDKEAGLLNTDKQKGGAYGTQLNGREGLVNFGKSCLCRGAVSRP